MLVDTDNLVTLEEFQQNPAKYVAAAQQGRGPVAVAQNSKVLGFFVGADEYDAMFGTAVHELLSARAKGPTVSHDAVCQSVNETLQRERKRRRSRK